MSKPTLNLGIFFTLYLGFLFYGCLYPFHGWRVPDESIISILLFGWVDYIFLFDIFQNLLLYLPFGLFAGGYLITQKSKKFSIIFLPTLASLIVSLAIETTQAFNPARLPSLLDLLLNIAGGMFGAMLSLHLIKYYEKLIYQAKASIHSSSQKNLWPIMGMAVWIVWAGSQIYPFLPTLHPNQLLQSLSPVYLGLMKEIHFHTQKFFLYAMQGTMLYFSGKLFLKPNRFFGIVLGFVILSFIGKIIAVGRFLSLEAVLGIFGAITLLWMAQKMFEILSQISDKRMSLRAQA